METGKEEKTDSKKEQESIENAQLRKMIATLTEKMEKIEADNANRSINVPINAGMSGDDIAKIVKAAISKEKEIDYNSGIDEVDIPVEDFDEIGVRFCAPFTGYVISDDKRKGHRVVLPYGKKQVFFEYQAARRVMQGRFEAIAPYSAYTSHSKKEIEWLKAHRLYNIFFYESATMAANSDVMRMQKLARIMTVLQNYDFLELIRVCGQYGVAKGEDAAVMRSHLAFEMVEREIESEKNAAQKSLDETFKAEKLLGRK